MTDRALVSIITPTWQRPALLAETIANVREQTYRPLEHVVVCDGLDAALYRAMRDEIGNGELLGVPIQFVSLGRNWSSFLPDSFCAAPITAGMLLARGDYQTWLADDERMSADHVEALVDALEAGGADFAYSRVRMYREGGAAYTIGVEPPQLGQITNVLYRADLLKRGLYPFNAGMTSDWACISRWMSRGARHAFVDRVTLTHRIDH